MSFRLIPLTILIIFTALGLGVNLGKHGEDKGKYNFGTSLIAGIIEWGLIVWMVI